MAETIRVEGYTRRNVFRKRRVLGGSIGATKVAHVSAHEDKGIRSGTSEAANMSNGMTRYVQKVEATVTEKIVCRELAYFLTYIKFDFPDMTPLKVFLQNRRVLLCRISAVLNV